MNNYRERFYKAYATTASANEYIWSEQEYELYAKVNDVKYKIFLPEDKKARMLDVACGAGHFLYFLQNKKGYCNSEGIDISEEQINFAKKMGLSNLHCGDFLRYLCKHPNSYDLITAHHVIEHLKKEEVLDLLDAIKTSLRPEGRIIISTGNVASLFGASHICSDFTHEFGYTPRSLRQLLQATGFEELTLLGIGPTAYDFKSSVRKLMWKMVKTFLTYYHVVAVGKGRLKEKEYILEHELLGTGVVKT